MNMHKKTAGPFWPLLLAAGFALLALLFLCEAVFSRHLAYDFPFIGYGGTFRWPSLNIGGVSVSLYWSAHAVGVAAMCILCLARRGLYEIGRGQAIAAGLLLAPVGYLGAKLLFIAENLPAVLQNGLGTGGVSFFGAAFFVPVAFAALAAVTGRRPARCLDFCAPPVILMLACIRCGCFMRGCCHGPTVWVGPNPVIPPVQLMECSLDLLLLFVLLRLERAQKHDGLRYAVLLGGYGTARFLLEFLRDTPKNHLGLSNGQWFSLLCMALCAGCLFVSRQRRGAAGTR